MADRMSHDARPLRSHTALAAYVRLIVRLVAHWGVSASDVLSGTGIEASVLEDPVARVPLDAMIALIERAQGLTREPGLGWYAGMQIRIAMYGFVGFGILSAATIGKAIDVLVQFYPLLSTFLTMRIELEPRGQRAFLVIDENADLGPAREFMLAGVVVASWNLSHQLSGEPPRGSADLMFPEPEYFSRVARSLFGEGAAGAALGLGERPLIRFGQPVNRLVFDRSRLDSPVRTADEAANKLALAQCEEALRAFSTGLVESVRRMVSGSDAPPTLGDVAAELHLSARSLTRKLAVHGTSFATLLEEARRDKALLLLQSDLSIAEISERLGYSTPPNFVRAFRSWTSQSPGAYRRSLGAERKA
jgi:AraC-like DNA-binding protein